MAAAIVAASSAAAGFDKRASAASSLQTPGSGSFPSELLSPMAASPGYMKREDALKTPITPPSAYLDFLRTMSPAIVSPAASTSASARFSFNEKSFDKSTPESNAQRPSLTPPTSQPALSRNPSYDSTSSGASEQSATSKTSAATGNTTRPESPRIIIPPSPFAKPGPRSARTPRLRIPQSPFSPAMNSAKSVSSPYSTTPLSSAPWSASFSPRESNIDLAGQPGKVSVRHVVTRTVTYCRTPLEPAPKGKRRKIERDCDDKDATPEPLIKHEKIEELDESATDSTHSSPAAET